MRHIIKLILVLMLIGLPTETWAGKYIKELAIGTRGKSNDAIKDLTDKGFQVLGNDLNRNAGGNFIYLGYKTTDDPKEAITDIVVVKDNPGGYDRNNPMKSMTYNGKTYYPVPVPAGNDSGDLNRGASGKDLFLWFTRDNFEDGVVAANMYITSNKWAAGNVNKTYGGGPCDFNESAGGDDIYLNITKQIPSFSNIPQFDEMFDVCDLGGGLYKINIPLVAVDANKDTYILGYSTTALNVTATDSNGKEVAIVGIAKVRQGKDFTDNWKVTASMLGSNTYYNPNTLEQINTTGMVSSVDLTVSSSNKVDKVWTTILCKLPSQYSNFKLKGTGTTNYSSNKSLDLTITTIPHDVKAPNDINNITVVQPVLNMHLNQATNGLLQPQGSQLVQVVSNNPIYKSIIWDRDNKTFLGSESMNEGVRNFSLNIASKDSVQRYVLIMLGSYSSEIPAAGTPTEKPRAVYAAPVEIMPFHEIHNFSAEATRGIDDKGVFSQKNIIKWTINNYRSSDVVANDEMLVQRAHKADFSDAINIGNKPFYSGEADTANENNMNFTYVDEDEEGWYDSHNDSTVHRVYYRVVRALAYSLWKETCDTKYMKNDSITLNNQLADVASISFTKTKAFDQDKTVTVRVNLAASSDSFTLWDPVASIRINRYSPSDEHYQGRDYAEKTIIISGENVRWDAERKQWYAEVEDVQGTPYTHYYYTARIDASSSNYRTGKNVPVASTEVEANACYNETLAPFAKFEATQGTAKGKIALEWEVEDGLIDAFELTRRAHDDSDTQKIMPLKSQKAMSYIDESAVSGKVYEYTLTAKCTVRGKTYTASKTAYGWNPYFATLSGKVQMPDGSFMAGPVTISVKAKDSKSVNIEECKIDGEVIMPGYNNTYEDQMTTTDGSFSFENIPYISEGIEYEVTVNANGVGMEYAGHKGSTFSIQLNDALYKANMNFVCSDTKRISGRVLYQHSTIPVNECGFYMNGYPLLDAHGNMVTTDNKGNFSFFVPAVDMTLQARKDGHTLDNDGFIIGIKADQTGGNHNFRPSKNYDGLMLTDATKVRLVGRMIGGNVQGKLPVGLGITKNNIGDNLKMVLELEGDNTAQILYLEDQPDLTKMAETYSQTVSNGSQGINVNKTAVSVEKKRIVVTPDVKTGEFCLDLAPAKYKVTELSATGYTTLFADGEGFEVLDLTNDIEKKEVIYYNDKTRENLSTTYNSIYQKVYHTPVKVTYKQSKYGMEQSILGADKISELNLKGERINATVATYDKATDKVSYLFGYPVFEEGKTYQLIVSAHEDFYYNGNTSTQPDIVHLDAGRLKVRNGLESSISEQEYELDSLGTAIIDVKAGNTTFNLKEENALRTLSMQVLNNGYYYNADPLMAYVTGYRDKGKDVVSIESDITMLDVVRDPYGSHSYAYREAGTKYHWDRELELNFSSSLDIRTELGTSVSTNIGVWGGVGGGAYAGTNTASSSTMAFTIPIPLYEYSYKRNAQYDMTLNTRVETSSDPNEVGARADVYIGAVNTVDVGRMDVFCVIDEVTYNLVKPAVDAKAIRIVSQGTDENGKPFYLAIAEKLAPRIGMPRQFIYTQKHIVSNVIPNLVQMYKSLILTGSREEVQQIANATKTVQYRMKDGKTIQDEDCYETISPETEDYNIPAFTPDNCMRMIGNWIAVIATNESKKIAAVQSHSAYARYSLSSDTKINHTEQAQWYDRTQEVHELLNINLSGEELSENFKIPISIPLGSKSFKKENDNTTQSDNGDVGVSLETPGFKFKFSFEPEIEAKYGGKYNILTSYSGGSGYVLQTAANAYLDIDVYSVDADTLENGWDNGQWKFVQAEGSKSQVNIHDYVFVVRGGAERMPWFAPDSTLYYEIGTALGARTLRIDNPKIYIDQPVVSNLPADEKAYFSLRLTNETELPEGTDFSKFKSSVFTLKLDDKSTPDGAIVTIDGMPLKADLKFTIAPGESITKTLAVERSGNVYDYNDIKIVLRDDNISLTDFALLSVHYLPASTPVRITRPVDQWVMNTLSPVDEQGRYYLPIEVTDFDINYANFDHIELQYKKKSEGDTKWVNLCSYYAQEDLYAKASGEKAMIKSGTISHRFYGDADPMEMSYDIRAVSFCRLGTGFVSKASNVMTGRKDTRPPVVFGVPKPGNGVMTFSDVISIPFNEPIAYNYLDETANFRVTSLTNDSEASYETSLRFPHPKINPGNAMEGWTEEEIKLWEDSLNKHILEENDLPISKVTRNLIGQDFTLEAMVKLDDKDTWGFPIAIIGANDMGSEGMHGGMYLSVGPELQIKLSGGGTFTTVLSENPEYESLYKALYQKLTHVAVSFTQNPEDGDIYKQIHFYIDGIEVPVGNVKNYYDDPIAKSEIFGNIVLGKYLFGNMADVRIWSKAMSITELNNYRGKLLTGSEPSLMCYWPMNERTGNVLYDKVGGADLHFNRQTWEVAAGQHSLRLDGDALRLQDTDKFLRYENEDYTLSYWFNVDKDNTVADNVMMLQSGSDLDSKSTSIYFDDSNLVVKSGSNKYNVVTRDQAMDEQWHNIMIVANKSLNNVALYFDGLLTRTISGTDFCGLQQAVQLGSNEFYGNVDELSLWHLALPANSLDKIYKSSLTGNEMGLAYYLPFERDTVNSQNTHEKVFSTYNEVFTKTADGQLSIKKQAFEDRVLHDQEMLARISDAKRFCPAKPAANVTNIPFSWTATDNELQINILETDAKINHQYISVTVRGVEDLAGNSLVNPQMLLVYADRNVLTWDSSKSDLNLKYGEGTTARLTYGNKSGRTVNYRIEESCSWLKPSKIYGALTPLESDYIDFEISSNLAPGEYSSTIYLVDEDNLCSPHTINVSVTGEEPEWAVVNSKDYTFSMNVIGQVQHLSKENMLYLDTDERDIVGVFYNGVCVGKSHISADNEANKTNLNLTIYGNKSMLPDAEGKKELTFLIWCASTNQVTILKPFNRTEPITFEHNAMVGCPPDEPVIFIESNERKQIIALKEGWNWMSFNIIPNGAVGLNELFESNNAFTEGDWISVNNMSSQLIKDSEGKLTWSSGMDSIDNLAKHVYKVFAQNPVNATIYGYGFAEQSRFAQLTASTDDKPYRWNELPYLLTVDQPIHVAMSDFYTDKAPEGTVIKSLKEFAVMDKNGKWVGSLQHMHPGQGYFVKYLGTEDATVHYTNVNNGAAFGAKQRAMTFSTQDEPLDLVLEEGSRHQSSMPVIAQIGTESGFREGDIIVAYSGNEVSATAEPTEMEDGRKLFFITLNADNNDVVRFAHIRDGEVIAKSSNGVTFNGDVVTGTLDIPYTIDFSAQADGDGNVFDISGRNYGKERNIRNRRGIFIINEKKIMKTGSTK